MAFDKLKDLLGEVVDTVQKTVADLDKNPLADLDKIAIAKMDKQKEANRKKAPRIIAKDFSSDARRCKFYLNNNYDEPYSQGQWMEMYREICAQNDPQLLAPMYNAIVVDEGGYYLRRGLEKLVCVSFAPGVNDEISMTFAVEPYTYKKVKRTQTAQSSTSARSTSSARATSPSGNMLSYSEQNEISEAKRRYERAVARASGYSGSKMLAEMNADEEKRAYAEYMRVLAKYAGRI